MKPGGTMANKILFQERLEWRVERLLPLVLYLKKTPTVRTHFKQGFSLGHHMLYGQSVIFTAVVPHLLALTYEASPGERLTI